MATVTMQIANGGIRMGATTTTTESSDDDDGGGDDDDDLEDSSETDEKAAGSSSSVISKCPKYFPTERGALKRIIDGRARRNVTFVSF